jgi:hypothetical protein
MHRFVAMNAAGDQSRCAERFVERLGHDADLHRAYVRGWHLLDVPDFAEVAQPPAAERSGLARIERQRLT